MKYCDFNGCSNKIERGRYCEDHTRKSPRVLKNIYHNSNKSFYNSNDWKSMRRYIYEKAKGCCQRCGRFVYGRQAQVHHIVPIKKNPLLKLEPSNLRLLCPVCHSIEENSENQEKVFAGYFK
ncbi:HNH endonuclease [Sporosarcina cyprini]|uniref:HNH endonuclease n=1 Tax=Sporosarcina cyprini TaxID=2910523 RepID=UPI001EDEA6C1|nr:HNH endonuclease [Sporosarcina cyprini]MCG3089144.1 HNH endonuclease [Sporosarcina cyprini]